MKKLLLSAAIKALQWIIGATQESFSGLLSTAKFSLLVTPLILLWNKIVNWGINNQDYILIVLGAIMIDWFFGTLKHLFFTGTFTLKRNAIGLTTKISLAVAGGFLFEGLNYIVSDADFVLTTSKMLTRMIILMYPGISAFENIYIVSGEKFPPKAWMERLMKWRNSLNPKDLMNQ